MSEGLMFIYIFHFHLTDGDRSTNIRNVFKYFLRKWREHVLLLMMIQNEILNFNCFVVTNVSRIVPEWILLIALLDPSQTFI